MLQGLALLPFSTYALFNPEKMNGLYFFTFNSFVLTAISLLSTPVLLIFSLLMSISNFTLIKREGKRLSNLLGIIISFLLLSGVILVLIQFILFSDEAREYLKVSPKHMSKALTRGIVSSVFVYFECNLLVTLILAMKAGRHKPKFDKDYLIILGCGIKKTVLSIRFSEEESTVPSPSIRFSLKPPERKPFLFRPAVRVTTKLWQREKP